MQGSENTIIATSAGVTSMSYLADKVNGEW